MVALDEWQCLEGGHPRRTRGHETRGTRRRADARRHSGLHQGDAVPRRAGALGLRGLARALAIRNPHRRGTGAETGNAQLRGLVAKRWAVGVAGRFDEEGRVERDDRRGRGDGAGQLAPAAGQPQLLPRHRGAGRAGGSISGRDDTDGDVFRSGHRRDEAGRWPDRCSRHGDVRQGRRECRRHPDLSGRGGAPIARHHGAVSARRRRETRGRRGGVGGRREFPQDPCLRVPQAISSRTRATLAAT